MRGHPLDAGRDAGPPDLGIVRVRRRRPAAARRGPGHPDSSQQGVQAGLCQLFDQRRPADRPGRPEGRQNRDATRSPLSCHGMTGRSARASLTNMASTVLPSERLASRADTKPRIRSLAAAGCGQNAGAVTRLFSVRTSASVVDLGQGFLGALGMGSAAFTIQTASARRSSRRSTTLRGSRPLGSTQSPTRGRRSRPRSMTCSNSLTGRPSAAAWTRAANSAASG